MTAQGGMCVCVADIMMMILVLLMMMVVITMMIIIVIMRFADRFTSPF